MKPKSKAEGGAIVLARLQDPRVRRFLAQNGLKADELVGDDGYLLFSDKTHLIVAAKTGQGLFYGVQTGRGKRGGRCRISPARRLHRHCRSCGRGGKRDATSVGFRPLL
jgi:hypothetical protein